MQIFAKTDVGKVRDINQDAFYINTLCVTVWAAQLPVMLRAKPQSM